MKLPQNTRGNSLASLCDTYKLIASSHMFDLLTNSKNTESEKLESHTGGGNAQLVLMTDRSPFANGYEN